MKHIAASMLVEKNTQGCQMLLLLLLLFVFNSSDVLVGDYEASTSEGGNSFVNSYRCSLDGGNSHRISYMISTTHKGIIIASCNLTVCVCSITQLLLSSQDFGQKKDQASWTELMIEILTADFRCCWSE